MKLIFNGNLAGADPGFSWGGGGGSKDYVRARTSQTQSPKSFSAGVKGPLKGPGSSRILLCSLVLSEPYF